MHSSLIWIILHRFSAFTLFLSGHWDGAVGLLCKQTKGTW